MQALGYTRPTRIQTLAFRSILDGKSCIIADQTGSGKTLSYLVPTLQLTRELNDLALPSREPIVVVVTPTTELACQVAKVAKSLAHTLKFRTACVTALSEMDSEQRKLRLGVELLIATPGSLLRLVKRGEVSLKRTRTIVLDEADALFLDETFPLQPIGAACGSQTQFVFVTATLPEKAYDQIRREFPEAVEIKGPGLHKISPKIEEVLVDCSGPRDQPKSVETSFQNKQEALLEAIDRYPSDRTLVFCNCIEQCRKVENALLRADRQLNRYVVLPCHGAIETMKRKANLERFAGPLEEDWSGTDRSSTAWRRQRDDRTSSSCGLPMIMVCTDRAARGIDFDKSPVEHVVLFDFPAEPAEYVRRVGRTGRAGRFGKVTVLAVGPQVPLARQVMAASKAGRPIE